MVVQDERLITLNLLNLEIMGSTIAIIGLSIFILTSYRAKNIILNSYLNSGYCPSTLPLDVAALAGRVFLVSAGLLAAYTTTIRLNQLTQKLSLRERQIGTLIPNVWLTIGTWTSLFGGVIALVGDYKRTQQTPRVPIE